MAERQDRALGLGVFALSEVHRKVFLVESVVGSKSQQQSKRCSMFLFLFVVLSLSVFEFVCCSVATVSSLN